MALSSNTIRALQGISPQAQRAIIDEFTRLSERINTLENQTKAFTVEQKRAIEDIAIQRMQWHGAQSIGTWKIKNKVRVIGGEIRKTPDLVILSGGDLFISSGSEVIVGR